MPGVFSKKSSGGNLPPAGAIRFTVANSGPWTLDDSTNLSFTPTAAEAALIRGSHLGLWIKET